MGITILLTISTCLSMGTGKLVEGYKLEAAKEKSNEVLKIASDEFDPTQYPLLSNKTEEQQNEILKSIILDSFINFDFCSDEIKTSLKNFYNTENQNSSLDYIETANLSKNNSLFYYTNLSNSLALEFVQILLETKCYIDFDKINSIIVQEEKITSEDTTLEIQDEKDGEVEENEESTDLIPLIENHDNSNLSININQKIDSKLFIGLDFPMDTCISFYNIVSNWLNKKAMMTTIGTSALWKYIIFLLSTNATSSTIMTSIISLFSSIWKDIMAFFTTTGALGIIVGAIFTIAAISTIYVVCKIYIAGSKQKGWRIGTLFHSLFKWEWLNEIY